MLQNAQREYKEDIIIKIVLFVFSPFIGFLYSLIRIRTRSSLIIFFLFALTYGMSLTVPDGRTETFTSDGASYRGKLYRFQNMSDKDFEKHITSILTLQSDSKDIYFPLVAFYAGKVTHNYHFTFFIFSIFFGYFMIRSLAFLVHDKNFRWSLICFFLLFLFTLNGIQNINGMRFWTAAWISVYCILNITLKRNNFFFIPLFLTYLVHAGFLVFILLFLLYYYTGKYRAQWVFLFFTSFLLSSFSTEVGSVLLNLFPQTFQRFQVYLEGEEEAMLIVEETTRSLAKIIFDFTAKAYINIMFLLLYRDYLNNKKMQGSKLIDFLLIYMTIINFTMPIPSFGVRFIVLTYPLLAFLWLRNFKDKKYKWYIYLMPIFMLHPIHNVRLLFFRFVDTEFFYYDAFSLIKMYLIDGYSSL